MTKAELIRKLAKRNGVPDSETKIFFESFLRKTSSILKRGEAVKISGMGYFQLRQGIIKEPPGIIKENIIYSDLMVFFPIQKDEVYSEESLIFNVPFPKEESFNEVDSYFSLSIGKPVIPLEGVSDTEYFSPPSEHELKKIIETKIDKILQSSEIINKYIKGNEVLIIEPEKYNNEQYEFEWVEKKEEVIPLENPDDIVIPEEKEKSEIENLAWNFGEDLTKEIEEEAIIDSANIAEPLYEENKDQTDLDWNFEQPDTEEAFYNNPENDESDSAGEPENAEEHILTADAYNIKDSISENYERVKSITSFLPEREDLPKTIENLDEIKIPEETNTANEFIHPDEVEDEGVEELSAQKINIDEHSEVNTVEPDEEVQTEIPEREITEEKNLAETPSEKLSGKKLDEVSKSKYARSAGRNSPAVFVIALVLIIAAGVLIFFILRQHGAKSSSDNSGTTYNRHLPASSPVIVKRSYDIPVTYPYPPKGKTGRVSGQISGSSSNGTTEDINGVKPSGEKNPTAAVSGRTKSSIKKGKRSRPIKDYIFKSEKGYTVQVSSWQSESVARKEAEKFSGRGYKGFIEKVNIKNRGTWYRVKVGYFKSLLSAEKFFNKNQ